MTSFKPEQPTPEFSPEEIQRLETLKHKVEEGLLGGPQDIPKEMRWLEFLRNLVEDGKIGGAQDSPETEFAHLELPDSNRVEVRWNMLPPEIRKEAARIAKKGEGMELIDSFNPKDIQEIFYQVLKEKLSEFDIEIVPVQERRRGVRVHPKRLSKLRAKIERMNAHPIIDALKMDNPAEIVRREKFEQALRLEREGKLPLHFAERLLARTYTHEISLREQLLAQLHDAPARTETLRNNIATMQQELAKLTVEPLSDEEIKEVFEQAVEESLYSS